MAYRDAVGMGAKMPKRSRAKARVSPVATELTLPWQFLPAAPVARSEVPRVERRFPRPSKVAFRARTRGYKPMDWGLEEAPDPNRMLSWKAMAEHAGVSLSTAKRWVIEGKLPKPQKIGKRKIGFRASDIDAALARM